MNRIRTTAIGAIALLLAIAGTTVFAQDMSEGEVRKVDKDSGKLTLKHGEIKNLDMPPMTMIFTVRNKALLDTVKTGDRVKFKAVKEDGRYMVVELQPAS